MSATAASARHDPDRIGHDDRDTAASNPADRPSGESGASPPRIIVGYGFWIFLLSDIIMFAAFFATYAVLIGATAGGPRGRDLFDISNVAVETGLLLASSFTCGMASIATTARHAWRTQFALALTGLLGAAFLLLEVREFAHLVAIGAGPGRSAFLSAFFALVGAHGLHVAVGLLWLGTMMAQVFAHGFTRSVRHRLLCFSLFWHALDIVWVAVFTVVYLLGAGQ